jgi:hypothetical protein
MNALGYRSKISWGRLAAVAKALADAKVNIGAILAVTAGASQCLACSFRKLTINLWCLFADFRRIDDELERIRVLILFHQFQIGEPLGALQSFAVGVFWLSGFDQLRGQCIPAVCGETVGCTHNLRFGNTQIVNEDAARSIRLG